MTYCENVGFERIKKYDNNADLVLKENIGEVFRQVMEKIEG